MSFFLSLTFLVVHTVESCSFFPQCVIGNTFFFSFSNLLRRREERDRKGETGGGEGKRESERKIEGLKDILCS